MWSVIGTLLSHGADTKKKDKMNRNIFHIIIQNNGKLEDLNLCFSKKVCFVFYLINMF